MHRDPEIDLSVFPVEQNYHTITYLATFSTLYDAGSHTKRETDQIELILQVWGVHKALRELSSAFDRVIKIISI